MIRIPQLLCHAQCPYYCSPPLNEFSRDSFSTLHFCFSIFSAKFIIWDHFQLKKIYSISQIHLSMSCARHKLRQFNCLPVQTATVFYVLARTINERTLIFYKQSEIWKHSLCVCRDTENWNKSNRKGGRCWSVENETNVKQSYNWLPFLSMWAMMIAARPIPLITHKHTHTPIRFVEADNNRDFDSNMYCNRAYSTHLDLGRHIVVRDRMLYTQNI